jgi:hypothetical protein
MCFSCCFPKPDTSFLLQQDQLIKYQIPPEQDSYGSTRSTPNISERFTADHEIASPVLEGVVVADLPREQNSFSDVEF